MYGEETQFPPFLGYTNATNTITLSPTQDNAGSSAYYFAIVVKESNSSTVMYTYYCSVLVTGFVEPEPLVCDPNSRNETIRAACGDEPSDDSDDNTYETPCDI